MNQQKYSYKPYEPIYKNLFVNEKALLQRKLGKNVSIEHFGSTAVPNLGGKGIIDIYVVTPKINIDTVSQKLQNTLNYMYRPAGGNKRRLFFKKYQLDEAGNKRTYHLHLSKKNNPDYLQAIVLRDYLRSHSEAVKKYDETKKEASEKAMSFDNYEKQKQTYQQYKANMIATLKRASLLWDSKNN